jgi:hypothetical protein
MIEKVILCPDRVRKITGPFGFIEHRFLREGFSHRLTHQELVLYLFLVLVSDRHGLSSYRYDKISTLLRITVEEFILARDGLLEKDLLAFDGRTFQVLSLPPQEPKPTLLPPPPRARGNGRKRPGHHPPTHHSFPGR